MSWFTETQNDFATKNGDDFAQDDAILWWSLFVNPFWDAILYLWDDPLLTWDAVGRQENWYTDSNIDWQEAI